MIDDLTDSGMMAGWFTVGSGILINVLLLAVVLIKHPFSTGRRDH